MAHINLNQLKKLEDRIEKRRKSFHFISLEQPMFGIFAQQLTLLFELLESLFLSNWHRGSLVLCKDYLSYLIGIVAQRNITSFV